MGSTDSVPQEEGTTPTDNHPSALFGIDTFFQDINRGKSDRSIDNPDKRRSSLRAAGSSSSQRKKSSRFGTVEVREFEQTVVADREGALSLQLGWESRDNAPVGVVKFDEGRLRDGRTERGELAYLSEAEIKDLAESGKLLLERGFSVDNSGNDKPEPGEHYSEVEDELEEWLLSLGPDYLKYYDILVNMAFDPEDTGNEYLALLQRGAGEKTLRKHAFAKARELELFGVPRTHARSMLFDLGMGVFLNDL